MSERRSREPTTASERATTLRRLGRGGKSWRLGAAGVVLAALIYGTAWGSDDHFPFGPFVMFAFSVDLDGEIRSTWVEADTTAGERVRVSLSPRGVGLRRAEIEGQLGKLRKDPSLMQAIAVAHRRINPDEPRYTTIYIVTEVTELRDGVRASRRKETVATWHVR